MCERFRTLELSVFSSSVSDVLILPVFWSAMRDGDDSRGGSSDQGKERIIPFLLRMRHTRGSPFGGAPQFIASVLVALCSVAGLTPPQAQAATRSPRGRIP